MGLSILVTTAEQREDIAMQLIQAAVLQDTGGIRGTVKLKGELRNNEMSYNPESDIYAIPDKNIRGDLLNLFCRVRNIDKADGGTAFCEEFGLDADKLRQKAELLTHVGFTPCMANEGLGPVFQDLTMLTQEQERALKQQYGWSKRVIRDCRVTMYHKGDAEYAAFPYHNKSGILVSFNAITEVPKRVMMHLGNKAVTPHLFPDPKNIDIDGPILLTVGYISSLCAMSQGVDATGIINWSTDLLPADLLDKFHNRDVVIALPADKTNLEKAKLLAESLHPIAKDVKVLDWPASMGMPETNGKRLADYFREFGGTIDSLNDLQASFTSGGPLPLRRELPKASLYPVDALPPVIRDAVLAVANAMQCSPALPAQSFLAVSALSVQGFLNVEIDGRESPSSCFFVTIAESGERKSSIDKQAMAPIIALEAELRAESKKAMEAYGVKLLIRKKQETDALKAGSPEEAFQALGPPPEHPLDGSLTCEEPTYEGLVLKMVHGQPSIGIFSDEGGRFLGGSAMSKENQLKSSAGLSTMWDGRAVTRTRVGTGDMVLNGRRVSMHLMVQPAIAVQLFSNELLLSQGITSRILIAFPQSSIGNRPYSRVNLKDSKALKRFSKAITDIHGLELPLKPGTTNELAPIPITLSDDAMERWIEFHNLVESEMAQGQQYANISGFAAKSAEHVARLACVMTFMNDTDAEEIPLQWVESAIRIVEYHLSETLRIFFVGQDDPELKLAERLLEWLRKKFPTFSLEEIYQNGPTELRDAKNARRIVKILEAHRWVCRIEGGATVGYKKHRTAWQVVA